VLLAGIAFGATPLEQLGVGLAVLVVVAIVVVRLGHHDLQVTRRIAPDRARPGQRITLTIDILNRGSGPAPLLLLEDRVPSGVSGSARFALQGVEPRGSRSTAIPLKAARRGHYRVGPLGISVEDPFGLARVRSTGAPASEFLVHPQMETLSMPGDLGERRSLATSTMRQPTGAQGEDFYTLREYVEGDPLKKIHWPSTAKRGRYIIRQEETPWHTRATILLDDRSGGHGGHGPTSSFERAVEASASLVDLYSRSGYGFRLLATHAGSLGSGRGSDHRNRCLDLLATIRCHEQVRGDDDADLLLVRLAELQAASSPEAALVVITGTVTGSEALALSRCRRRFRTVTSISFPAHRFGSAATRARWEGERSMNEAAGLLARSQVRSLVLGPDESLAAAWTTVARARTSKEDRWAQRPELV
jgi:uncharacterized repeat protein (TIGR01451 family)